MKADIFLFGNLAGGYSQYPDNYTRDLFEQVGKSRKAESEIVYHRDGALTYYIYTREVSKSQNTYIGLCYVLNDVLVKNFDALFTIFEDIVTNMVVTGELLEFSDEGNLTSKVDQLYLYTKELKRISDYMNAKLDALGSIAEKLPPVNYAVAKTEWKDCSYEEHDVIQTAITDYSNIRITKGTDYDTQALSSYSGKLRALSTERNQALALVEQQKDEISALKRKQKNFVLVLCLFMLLCIGGAISYRWITNQDQTIKGLNSDLVSSEITIEDLEDRVEQLQYDKDDLTRANNDLEYANDTLTEGLVRARDKIVELNEQISDLQQRGPRTYQVYAQYGNSTECYYRNSYGSFYSTGTSISDYTYIDVYYTVSGYGLTPYGYVRMSDLRVN
jgi:cell division protein FtsB